MPTSKMASATSEHTDWRTVLLAAMGLDHPDEIDPTDQALWGLAYANWMMDTGRLERARVAIATIRALHQPTSGAGFLADGGRGDIDPACSTCGTSDEYAVPYPCPTICAIGDLP